MDKEKKTVKITLSQAHDMHVSVGNRLFFWGFSMDGPNLICVGDFVEIQEQEKLKE